MFHVQAIAKIRKCRKVTKRVLFVDKPRLNNFATGEHRGDTLCLFTLTVNQDLSRSSTTGTFLNTYLPYPTFKYA